MAALSRVFLTASKESAVWVATGIGIVIFLVGAVIATKPKISSNAVAGVLVLAAAGVITAGVVSAARGERTIEPHHADDGAEHATEGESEHDEADEADDGLRPLVPQGTSHSDTTTTEAEG